MARKNHVNIRAHKPRQVNKKFLIVTEDTKSAYHYFRVLKKANRLPTLNIEVEPSKKSAPDQVVSFTVAKAKELEAELSFCVIDRDTHEHFSTAIKKASKIKNLEVIASYPCFEYWIILHHNQNCYRSMTAKECEKETINKFKSYDKSMDAQAWFNFYNNELASHQNSAIQKAMDAEEQCQRNGTENPQTQIYKLFNTDGYPFYVGNTKST